LHIISPKIKIYCSVESGICTFIVEDNGIGLEEKYYDKIFSVFQRLHNRSEFEGTGIGLASCKKIVEVHGGTIRVESKINIGSKFIFTIPSQS